MATNVTVPGGDTDLGTISLDYNRNLAPLTTQLLSSVYQAAKDGNLEAVTNPTSAPAGGGISVALVTTSMDSVPTGYTNLIIAPTTQPGAVSNVAVDNTNTNSGQTVAFGTAGSFLLTGTGQGTIVGSLGANTVQGTGGDWTVYTDGSTDSVGGSLIFGGSSVIRLESQGADTFVGGTGNASLAAYAGGAIFYGGQSGSNTLFTNATDGADGVSTYVGGAGSSTIFANNTDGAYVGTSGSLTFINSGGSNTLFGGSGSETLFAGSGSGHYMLSTGQTVFINSGGDQAVFGGALPSAYFSAGGQISLIGNTAGGNSLIAMSGNNTLSTAFSSSNNTLSAGNGQDMLFGGSGNDTFFSGSGAATMVGGGGKDVFVMSKGVQDVTIYEFNASSALSLNGWGLSEENAAIANQTSVMVNGAASTRLTLSDNTTVTIVGLNHLNTNQVANG